MTPLELIIRLKDSASAGLRRVQEELKGTKSQADNTKPGLEGLSGTIKNFGQSFQAAQGAIVGALGVIGLVIATFKTVYSLFKPLGTAIRDLHDPLGKLADSWEEVSERTEAANKILSQVAEEEKEKIDELAQSFERLSKDTAEQAAQEKALADAIQKSNAARAQQRIAQVSKDEKAAIAMGYDPEAVQLVYGDERRRAQADSEISSAQAELDQAQKAVALAEKQSEIAVNRSIAMQNALMEAELQKSKARKLLAESENKDYSEKEREAKLRAALLTDRKADIAIRAARGGIEKSEEQESAAASAVAVARAQAAAAVEGVKTAELARSAAEQDYQADVRAFWDARDQEDASARAAELQAVREQAAERARLAEEQASADHQLRIDAIRAEAQIAEQTQAEAQSRLDRARTASAQAWSWYRDPQAFSRQLAEERANASAEKQFEKDAASLMRRTDWRNRSLDDNQEAVRRVVLAREEEKRAEVALLAIQANTAGVKEMLQTLLTSK